MYALNRINYTKYLAFVIFSLFTVWWLLLNLTDYGLSEHNREVYSASYFLLPLYGGLIGLHISKQFDSVRSVIGKSIFFLSLGLLAQVFGQVTYAVHLIYLKTGVSYPSIGDIGYFGSIPLYIYAVWALAKTFGVTSNSLLQKVGSVIFVFVLLTLSYYFFFT